MQKFIGKFIKNSREYFKRNDGIPVFLTNVYSAELKYRGHID